VHVRGTGSVRQSRVSSISEYFFTLFLPYFRTVWAIEVTSCFFCVKVEATVRFKHVLPLCDPWCDPTQYWWCIPCTGVYAQTILTIGGCAPYQTTSHCGGAVSFFLFPHGQCD